MPVEGADPDAGTGGNLGHRGIHPRSREHRFRLLEQLVDVALCVGAHATCDRGRRQRLLFLFEPNAALLRAGLSRASLSAPAARISVLEEQRLWDAVESLASDPAFGMRLGKHYVQAGLPGIEGSLGRHAATLRSSLLITDRYAQITDERARLSLLEVDDAVMVRIYREGAPPRALGMMEAMLATMNTFATELVDGYTLRAVALRRPRPASIDPYVDTFGVQPTFGAEHHELVFASESLECAVRGADLELGRILQQHLTDLVARAEPSDPLLHRLRGELTRRLESGSLELPDVATALA